jgi:hypothetical protein
MKNYNGVLKLKKKLKDGYSKVILFKVWVPNYKSDERSRVISEIFSYIYIYKKKIVRPVYIKEA